MIEKTLNLAVSKFNKITPKKKILNIKKFKCTSKYDSLDIINLAICIEEEFEKKNTPIKFSGDLKKYFKNYTSILSEIKKNVKKN